MQGKVYILILSLVIIFGCSFTPDTAINVKLSRDRYSPLLEQSKYSEYK